MIVHTFKMCTGDAFPGQSLFLFIKHIGCQLNFKVEHEGQIDNKSCTCRGGSRISGKGVRMFKGEGFVLLILYIFP